MIGVPERKERGKGEENVSDENMAKIFSTWDFPGGPVIRILCFHCRGHKFWNWLGYYLAKVIKIMRRNNMTFISIFKKYCITWIANIAQKIIATFILKWNTVRRGIPIFLSSIYLFGNHEFLIYLGIQRIFFYGLLSYPKPH